MGFILADQGFDVWVGNVRGTRWSHGHISLSERNKVSSLLYAFRLHAIEHIELDIFKMKLMFLKKLKHGRNIELNGKTLFFNSVAKSVS